MSSNDTDILMRLAAFKRVEMRSKMHGHLTHRELSTGFRFQGERIPLVNPQRGIFKPRRMRYALSIKTVIPKPGGQPIVPSGLPPFRIHHAECKLESNEHLRVRVTENLRNCFAEAGYEAKALGALGT